MLKQLSRVPVLVGDRSLLPRSRQQLVSMTRSSSTSPRHVLLVGSVPLKTSEDVMRVVMETVGDKVRYIPDGEVGVRHMWIGFQRDKFESVEALYIPEDAPNEGIHPGFHLRPGYSLEQVNFGPLGYAEAALSSYEVFLKLRRDGVIPDDKKFQVSLPTPFAPSYAFATKRNDFWKQVEPKYEHALMNELYQIVAKIPHKDLAVQWDVCFEVCIYDDVVTDYDISTVGEKRDLLERIIRYGNSVPPTIDMGFHLCYGDYQHKHFKDPISMRDSVEIANSISKGILRPIQWVMMPIPRSQTDKTAFFEPLENLHLNEETELFLGLVHRTDGFEGTMKRLNICKQYVSNFGICTECGLGRRPPDNIPDVLRLHSQVIEAEAKKSNL